METPKTGMNAYSDSNRDDCFRRARFYPLNYRRFFRRVACVGIVLLALREEVEFRLCQPSHYPKGTREDTFFFSCCPPPSATSPVGSRKKKPGSKGGTHRKREHPRNCVAPKKFTQQPSYPPGGHSRKKKYVSYLFRILSHFTLHFSRSYSFFYLIWSIISFHWTKPRY